MVQGSGSGFRIQGSGFRVQGSWCQLSAHSVNINLRRSRAGLVAVVHADFVEGVCRQRDRPREHPLHPCQHCQQYVSIVSDMSACGLRSGVVGPCPTRTNVSSMDVTCERDSSNADGMIIPESGKSRVQAKDSARRRHPPLASYFTHLW